MFDDLPSDFRVLIETNNENHLDAYSILNHLHTKGICLTFGRPADNLNSLLKAKGFPTSNLTFIDTISKKIKVKGKLTNCHYVTDFSEIFAAIESVASQPAGKKFLILDSLEELNKHHGFKSVLFMDFLGSMLATNNLQAIFLSNELDDEKMISYIKESCDRTIRI